MIAVKRSRIYNIRVFRKEVIRKSPVLSPMEFWDLSELKEKPCEMCLNSVKKDYSVIL